MSEPQDSSLVPRGPLIKRGSLESLSLYEITDYELDLLERGSASSIYLNFSILLLSVSISFLVTLLSVPDIGWKTYTFFLSSTIIGFVVGLVLLVAWRKTAQSTTILCEKIRGRIVTEQPSDTVPQSPSPPSENSG